MDGDMTGWKKRIFFDFFADIGEFVVKIPREVKLTTVAWSGIILSTSGMWLMLGPGFALFALGVFILVVALVCLDAENKSKKKNEKV